MNRPKETLPGKNQRDTVDKKTCQESPNARQEKIGAIFIKGN